VEIKILYTKNKIKMGTLPNFLFNNAKKRARRLRWKK
jgi:hypothetical protein